MINTLNDLLDLTEKELENTYINLNIRKDNQDPLLIFRRNPYEFLKEWVCWSSKSYSDGDIVIGLARTNEDDDEWLLCTIAKIISKKDLKGSIGVKYDVEEIVKYKKYFGKIFLKYHNKGRYLVLEGIESLNEFKVLKYETDYNDEEQNDFNIFESFFNTLKSDKNEFKKFNAELENEYYNNLEKIRVQFVNKFNIECIKKMDINDYVLGRKGIDYQGDNNFCYLLESKLSGFGSIKGATSSKFGIYYSNGEYKISTTKWNHKLDIAFAEIKEAILQLIEAGKTKDFSIIDKNQLSPMFKGKILATYYPDIYIPIFNEEHVNKFLKALDLKYPKDISLEEKKILLMEYRSKHIFFSNKPAYYFMAYLYSPIMKFNVLNWGKKEEKIDSNAIQIVDWNYIKIIEKKKSEKINKGKPDYEKANRDKAQIGTKGEDAILDYEKTRIIKLGLKRLIKQINRVSEESDSYGYDIESLDIINSKVVKIFIEVKTSRCSQEKLSFYITDNELDKFRTLINYRIYYLFDINRKPKLHIIKKEDFDESFLKPVLYKVDVEVKRK